MTCVCCGKDAPIDARCSTCIACRTQPPINDRVPALGTRHGYAGDVGVVVQRYSVDGRDRVILRFEHGEYVQPVDVDRLRAVGGEQIGLDL